MIATCTDPKYHVKKPLVAGTLLFLALLFPIDIVFVVEMVLNEPQKAPIIMEANRRVKAAVIFLKKHMLKNAVPGLT